MTRKRANEVLELMLMAVMIVSFIFVAAGLARPEAFIVASGIMFVVTVIGYYILNWIDKRES